MLAFITGATGFIGSHLAEALHAKGYKLRCLVRKSSNLVWIKHLPIEYVYGDATDREVLKQAVKGADFIFHVAGITKARTKEEYFRGNHLSTRYLLDAAIEANPGLKRFVLISSQTATGPGMGVTEDTPFHPITTYGISKMEAEKECLKEMGRLPITIVRPPAVYGPRDKDVFEFFNTMNKGLHPMIGFKDTYVSLVHVSDLVKGIILAAESPKALKQTYFISSERYYNWKEVGDLTSRILGKKAVTIKIPVGLVYVVGAFAEVFSLITRKPALLNFEKIRDIVQEAWTCDIAKAKRELAYAETTGLEEGIKNTVEWYRKEGWLK